MYKPLIEFNACLPQGFFISPDSLFGFLDIMISKNTANHPVSQAGKVRNSIMGSCLVIDIYGGDGGVSWIMDYNINRPLNIHYMFLRKYRLLVFQVIMPDPRMFFTHLM